MSAMHLSRSPKDEVSCWAQLNAISIAAELGMPDLMHASLHSIQVFASSIPTFLNCLRLISLFPKVSKCNCLDNSWRSFSISITNCIISICKKTNTNSLHTNALHSILCKIGDVIQIVVHWFVCKTTAKKILSLKKIGPLIHRYMEIPKISTKEWRVHTKHMEK